MDQRRKAILGVTVDSYIQTAEPVGSKGLHERSFSDVSPATIRHELHALEEDGYLSSRHVSSGRVPTDKGYRYYVDELMDTTTVSLSQKRLMGEVVALDPKKGNYHADVLAMLTSVLSYPSFMVCSQDMEEKLVGIHCIRLYSKRLLLLFWTVSGAKQDMHIDLEEDIAQDELNMYSQLLSNLCKEKTCSEICDLLLLYQDQISGEFLLRLRESMLILREPRSHALLVQGVSYLLRLPEFRDVELAYRIVEMIEESCVFIEALRDYVGLEGASVVIGSENRTSALKECSLVMVPFKDGTSGTGTLGVIGPTRMPYNTVLSLMSYFSNSLIQGGCVLRS